MTKTTNDQDPLDLEKKLSTEFFKAESFIEKNKKNILTVIGALVVVIGGYVGYRQLILAPQEKEAQAAIFVVQRQFDMDSFNLVINGNGTDMSAVEIADEYGSTKAGNLARYYAGMSYLRSGDYESAIDYLKGFKGNDMVVSSLATGAIGDAYVELGKLSEAVSYYRKAADKSENGVTAPLFLKKAGLVYEKQGEYKKAVECYVRIQEKFRTSDQGNEIEKYIYRAKALAGDLK
jgi:tetratricopeptide (TPR) repeat protein